MVPTSHGSYTKNPGPGQPGYIWSNIKNELDEVAGFCGIYMSFRLEELFPITYRVQ